MRRDQYYAAGCGVSILMMILAAIGGDWVWLVIFAIFALACFWQALGDLPEIPD